MANKLYQYKDETTGEVFKFEGPDDATEEEISQYLTSLSNPQESSAPVAEAPVPVSTPDEPAPVRTGKVQMGADYQKAAANSKNTVTTAAASGVSGPVQDWKLSKEDEAAFMQMQDDPNVSFEDIDAWAKSKGAVRAVGSAEQLQAYRESLAQSGGATQEVQYQQVPIEELMGKQELEFDPNQSDLGAAYTEGERYNPAVLLAMWYKDAIDKDTSTGIDKDRIRELYPDLDEAGVEAMMDRVIGETNRRKNAGAAYQADQQDMNMLTRFAGNMAGGVSLADVVPLTRGANVFQRGVEIVTVAAGTDGLLQLGQMAYGSKDSFDYMQNLYTVGGSVAFGGVVEATRATLKGLSRATRGELAEVPAGSLELPPAPISVPSGYGRRNSKLHKQQMAETVEQIDGFVKAVSGKWKNAPDFKTHDNFSKLNVSDKSALGVYDADTGQIHLNADMILKEAAAQKTTPEAVVASVTFHEALGHYGLAQKFGEDLDNALAKMLQEGDHNIQKLVADWLDENPKAYEGDPNRDLRALEEIFAEWSEQGYIPSKFIDRMMLSVKDLGRKMNMPLSYTPNELKAILGMAHGAVVKGKARDVVGNGFRFARVWHGSGAVFNEFDHSFMGSGEGAQIFGWGTYLTESRGIAEGYRDRYSKKVYVVGDKQVGSFYAIRDALREQAQKKYGIAPDEAAVDTIDHVFDYYRDNDTLPSSRKELSDWLYNDYARERGIDYEKAFPKFDEAVSLVRDDFRIKRGGGTYDVEIPDDAKWIHWDDPVVLDSTTKAGLAKEGLQVVSAEEFKAHREALYRKEGEYLDATGEAQSLREEAQYLKDTDPERYEELLRKAEEEDDLAWKLHKEFYKLREKDATILGEGMRGEEFYQALTNITKSPKEASLLLNKHGIDGITYPSGYFSGRPGRRADGKEASNFVVFNDKTPEIKARYMYAGRKSKTGMDPVASKQELWSDNMERAGGERFEFTDHRSRLTPEFQEALRDEALISGPLVDAFDHPRLFEEYPFLRDMEVQIFKPFMDFSKSIQGGFDPSTNTIFITPYAQDPHGTILHEVQHAIQEHEGWAIGGNQDEAFALMPDDQARETAENILNVDKKKIEDGENFVYLLEHLSTNPLVLKWRSAEQKYSLAWDAFKLAEDNLGRDHPKTKALSDAWYLLSKERNNAQKAFLESVNWDMKEILNDPSLFSEYSKFTKTLIERGVKSHETRLKDLRESTQKDRKLYESAREKFEKGGREAWNSVVKAHSEAKFEAYEALFGEVEARDTTARLNLNEAQRLAIEPYSSQRLPEEYYIFDFNKNSGSSINGKYMRSKPLKEIAGNEQLTNDELLDVMGANEILSRVLADFVPDDTRQWKDAKRDATARALTPSKALRNNGVGALDVRLFQYDAVAQRMSERLAVLEHKRATGKFTAEDKAEYLSQMYQFSALAGKIMNDQSELGRALNAIKAINLTRRNLGEMTRILSEYEGTSTVKHFADDATFNEFADRMRFMLQSGNTAGAAAMVRQSLKPYWWQYILSFRHAAMLSGLGTHAKNAVDNANMILRELEETALAMPLNQLRKLIRVSGKEVEQGVTAPELMGRSYGLMRALLDGQTYMKAAQAFKAGHGSSQISSKVEMQDARIPILSGVSDALYAADIFFRSFHDNANLHALGVRQASSEGFSGTRALEEGSAKAANPDAELLNAVKQKTNEALLVDSPSGLSSWVEPGKSIRPNMSGGEQVKAFVMNLMFPFFRVTDRLLFQAIRRSPLSILDKNTRADFMAGGARRDIAIARTAYGSALMYYYWQMAGEDGTNTGEGPKDYKKRLALEAGGWKPNAVKEGDSYFDATAVNMSMNPLDTQNAIAANVASIREAWERGADADDVAVQIGAAAKALLSIISSQSYAENLAQYIAPQTARSESEVDTAWANFAGGLASSFVPAAVRQVNQQLVDPYKRDTRGDKSFTDRVAGRVKSGIPGLSDDLPQKYDVYGDPSMQNRSTFGMDNYSNIKQDQVSQEVQKVEREFKSPVVSPAPASFKYEGETIKLDAAQQQEWQRLKGWYFRDFMSQTVTDPKWKNYTLEQKRDIIKKASTAANKWAKRDMIPQLGLDELEGVELSE